MDFDSFRRQWEGNRVPDPTLISIGYPENKWYQCVSFIKQYLREVFGLNPGYWGNAIDYWNNTSPALYDKFDRVPTHDVEKGDIVILNGVNGNTDGHIGLATGQKNSSQFELLEQNGATGNGSGLDGDAIRTRWIPTSRIAGVLRPKPVAPLSAPYHIEDIPTKEIQLKQNTYLWNMVYRTFDEIAAHPVQGYSEGYRETTAAICHHDCGESYYMVGNNETTGFNVKDCKDYVEPAPIPYVPPAAPVSVPKAETYKLEWEVPTYESSNDAWSKSASTGKLKPGSYIVYDKRDQVYNLTEHNMKPGVWVNIAEDVPPIPVTVSPKITEVIQAAAKDIPVTTPKPVIPEIIPLPDWTTKGTFLNTDGSPEYFYSINTVPMDIVDYGGKGKPGKLPPLKRDIPIVKLYDIPGADGNYVRHGLTKYSYDTGRLYLIPMRVLRIEKRGVIQKVVDAVNDIRFSEHFVAAEAKIKLAIQGFTGRKS